MSRNELITGVVLVLLGLGIMAGQGFQVNGWVAFFWSAAVLVFVYAVTHRDINAAASKYSMPSTTVAMVAAALICGSVWWFLVPQGAQNKTESTEKRFASPTQTQPSSLASRPLTAAPPHITTPPSSSVVQPEPSRTITTVTPEALTKLYLDNTSVQADRLASLYLGKWIDVRESVWNVHTLFEGDTVVITKHRVKGVKSYTISLGLGFELKWQDTLLPMRRGDAIHALCRIAKVETAGIDLDDCELVTR